MSQSVDVWISLAPSNLFVRYLLTKSEACMPLQVVGQISRSNAKKNYPQSFITQVVCSIAISGSISRASGVVYDMYLGQMQCGGLSKMSVTLKIRRRQFHVAEIKRRGAVIR